MSTNLSIEPELLNQAQKIGKFKTKKETVNTALLEFISKRKQLEIASLFGKIDYDEKNDYKNGRKSK